MVNEFIVWQHEANPRYITIFKVKHASGKRGKVIGHLRQEDEEGKNLYSAFKEEKNKDAEYLGTGDFRQGLGYLGVGIKTWYGRSNADV